MATNYPDPDMAPAGDGAADVGISLDAFEPEVLRGLPGHADRIQEAWDNEQYYRGKNAGYIARKESEEYLDFERRPKPTSKITRKVVRELTRDLYNPGPTRKAEHSPAVDAWLQQLYQANHVNALLQSADRKATLNATAAVQVSATGLPDKPLSLTVLGAHQFVIFPHPLDGKRPAAVCTVEKQHETSADGAARVRLRLELWSRDEHRVYLSKEADETPRFRDQFGLKCQYVPAWSGFPAGSGINPYGTLPFAFVHDEPPVGSFWEGGLGTMLRECNAEVDQKWSQLSNVINKHLDPDAFLRNVSGSFRREKRPGGWQHLPPGKNAEGDSAGEPDAFFVQPELKVEQALLYIKEYVSNCLEDLDVPLTAVRSDASTDLSGIAIVAKQLPLLSRTRARQVHFTPVEVELAQVCLLVAGNFYATPDLLAAARAPKLSVLWPEPSFPLPTPERDAADSYEIEGGIKSLIDVVAERIGGTRDQAKARIEQVAEDNRWLATVLAPAPPVAPADGTPPTTTPAPGAPAPEPDSDDND